MSKLRVKYKKNKHQADFQNDTHTKLLNLSSGYGGGKSHALVMKSLQLSFLNKDIPGGCVNPSIPDYKKDLLPLYYEILDANNVKYKYHQTDKWFKFPWTKAKMYVVSAEKKIKGPNWGWCVINEIGLIPWQRYEDILGRVRIKKATHPQIASSGTPEGTGHWTYEKFVDQPMKNSRIIFGDTRNNRENLSDDYIATLEDTYDSITLDAYLKGLFVNMVSNRFYYCYDPIKNDDDTIERVEDAHVHVSMDFNVDPFCATLWHIFPMGNGRGMTSVDIRGNTMYQFLAFDQIQLSGPKGARTENMCEAMRARGLNNFNTTIYPDPAGKARSTQGIPDIEILRRAGFTNIKVRLAAPRFRKRQLAHNNLLEKTQIKINPKTCKGLKRDYESVGQDISTFEKLKDNPKLTHFSDGADYMIDIVAPLSGAKPNSRVIKFR